MAIMKNVVMYVNDRDWSGLEGYLTEYEPMYKFLPTSKQTETSGKGVQSDLKSKLDQIHVRHS